MKKIIQRTELSDQVFFDQIDWENAKVLCFKNGKFYAMMYKDGNDGYIFRIHDGGGMCGHQITKKECCEKVMSMRNYELYLVD